MRARMTGTGVVLGLAVTVFGSPAAWADQAAGIDETALFPAAPVAPGTQVPRPAPDAGDGEQDAGGGRQLSVSLLALGIALGAGAGAGAIVWREVRR